jgi:uncharacterized protein YdhG (YjbR/CyaY superfamily)
MTKPESIDQYLSSVAPDRRTALEKLRQTIRSLVPNAVECISYSMPAFRLDGHVVAGFLATNKGCSYFPFSGTTLGTLASELTEFSQTKSALHFDPSAPLSKALVKKLLQARIAETRTQAPHGASAKPKKKVGKAVGLEVNAARKKTSTKAVDKFAPRVATKSRTTRKPAAKRKPA